MACSFRWTTPERDDLYFHVMLESLTDLALHSSDRPGRTGAAPREDT